jgi:hypothetical protein
MVLLQQHGLPSLQGLWKNSKNRLIIQKAFLESIAFISQEFRHDDQDIAPPYLFAEGIIFSYCGRRCALLCCAKNPYTPRADGSKVRAPANGLP